jgi:peptidoglycan hydrolase-like protein with peptidoglycan-binding domain
MASAVDLALFSAQDQAVVPGVTSRSQVLRTNRELEIQKFGTRFRLADSGSDGPSLALRGAVEVSSIELFGRLAKVPYWTCLGANDDDPAVAAEIRDWYDAMVARPTEIIEYFQAQMRVRRLYDGPIDGVVNPQIKDAVARYREALGLSREPKLSQEFLKAYLKANHREMEAKVRPTAAVATASPVAPGAAPAAPAASAVPATPLALRVAAANDARKFARGEVVQLTVKPSRDAHVYCFLQDENQKISRFFPNRFHRDSRVAAAEGVRLPGAMRFEIRMNPRGCRRPCRASRPTATSWRAARRAGRRRFRPVPVATLEQLRSGFVSVGGDTLAQESFRVQPK